MQEQISLLELKILNLAKSNNVDQDYLDLELEIRELREQIEGHATLKPLMKTYHIKSCDGLQTTLESIYQQMRKECKEKELQTIENDIKSIKKIINGLNKLSLEEAEDKINLIMSKLDKICVVEDADKVKKQLLIKSCKEVCTSIEESKSENELSTLEGEMNKLEAETRKGTIKDTNLLHNKIDKISNACNNIEAISQSNKQRKSTIYKKCENLIQVLGQMSKNNSKNDAASGEDSEEDVDNLSTSSEESSSEDDSDSEMSEEDDNVTTSTVDTPVTDEHSKTIPDTVNIQTCTWNTENNSDWKRRSIHKLKLSEDFLGSKNQLIEKKPTPKLSVNKLKLPPAFSSSTPNLNRVESKMGGKQSHMNDISSDKSSNTYNMIDMGEKTKQTKGINVSKTVSASTPHLAGSNKKETGLNSSQNKNFQRSVERSISQPSNKSSEMNVDKYDEETINFKIPEMISASTPYLANEVDEETGLFANNEKRNKRKLNKTDSLSTSVPYLSTIHDLDSGINNSGKLAERVGQSQNFKTFVTSCVDIKEEEMKQRDQDVVKMSLPNIFVSVENSDDSQEKQSEIIIEPKNIGKLKIPEVYIKKPLRVGSGKWHLDIKPKSDSGNKVSDKQIDNRLEKYFNQEQRPVKSSSGKETLRRKLLGKPIACLDEFSLRILDSQYKQILENLKNEDFQRNEQAFKNLTKDVNVSDATIDIQFRRFYNQNMTNSF